LRKAKSGNPSKTDKLPPAIRRARGNPASIST
jgi:hypothetical protein